MYFLHEAFSATQFVPPDLTKTRVVNELCNLLRSSHIMWKKLKTLGCPTGHVLSP